MQSPEASSSSPVLLNIGGKKYATTVETLTQREPDSMLAAMFSGRHTLPQHPTMGTVFVDRDGKHFRHVLNWLRDGAIPVLSESEYQQLLREAEYYQLLVKEKGSIPSRLLYKLLFDLTVVHKDLSEVDFSYACIKNTDFSCANLYKAKFGQVEASSSCFQNAILRECEFIGAKLQESILDGANLRSANLQDACLTRCSFIETDLNSAHLQTANLTAANLRGANLEAANLKGAKLSGTNLQGANLQRAYLREVDLRDTQLTGAKLGGANLLGAIR
ncbi:FH protein interacting protein FIP2 [Dichanthelium oligosanthes]|uniref:FH protein interacting protein FIP2 n=1 Tax=Dichanthelium oligosanthes TaxID=888268 RepID=A0A1E5WNL4_9POAL|nr:FH protein interacting protein FIP2 [Dichanthelium oligosanthes]